MEKANAPQFIEHQGKSRIRPGRFSLDAQWPREQDRFHNLRIELLHLLDVTPLVTWRRHIVTPRCDQLVPSTGRIVRRARISQVPTIDARG